ncbi:MAG: FAD-binding oxidoreductase [Chitinophagaceae bacterium]
MYYTRTTTKTRREFIKKSAMAAGVLTLLNACGQRIKSWKFPFAPDAINQFQKSFYGHIILPGDAAYETARRARLLNPEMDKHPAVIAQCKNEEDVLLCIDFARQHNLEVAVRSGNHSLLGWGTCENGLVIDLSKIKNVSVDPVKQTAQVTAGSTAEEILAATSPFGLAPVLGECGSVGAGLVLGGGLGYLSGKYGATCDTLLSANVLTADGRTLQANPSNNQDLFWAIRGGGGNFGVATTFEYQLYPENEVLAGRFAYPIEKTRDLLRFFREFMLSAPDELQGDCYYAKQGKGSFAVEFVYSGDLDKGERLINEFRKFLKPDQDWMKRRAYSGIYRMGEDWASDDGATPCPFQSIKGAYIKQLSDEVIDLILTQFEQAPPSCQMFFNLSHYMHGKVCRIASDSTAFELRQAGAADLAYLIKWADPKNSSSCMSWLYNLSELLQPYSGGRIYSNYMSTESGNSAKAVYGTNYTRLLQLKLKYDPQNFFHLNQNIRSKWK